MEIARPCCGRGEVRGYTSESSNNRDDKCEELSLHRTSLTSLIGGAAHARLLAGGTRSISFWCLVSKGQACRAGPKRNLVSAVPPLLPRQRATQVHTDPEIVRTRVSERGYCLTFGLVGRLRCSHPCCVSSLRLRLLPGPAPCITQVMILDPGIPTTSNYGPYTRGTAADVWIRSKDGGYLRNTCWPGLAVWRTPLSPPPPPLLLPPFLSPCMLGLLPPPLVLRTHRLTAMYDCSPLPSALPSAGTTTHLGTLHSPNRAEPAWALCFALFPRCFFQSPVHHLSCCEAMGQTQRRRNHTAR